MIAPSLTIVYDPRDRAAGEQARRHRSYWGKLYTDIHVLDPDHVALVFRSAGPRWELWERVRRSWIMRALDPGRAPA